LRLLHTELNWFNLPERSSRQLRAAGFFCGGPYDVELVTRQYKRLGHLQEPFQTFTEDVFIFSLLVYIAY